MSNNFKLISLEHETKTERIIGKCQPETTSSWIAATVETEVPGIFVKVWLTPEETAVFTNIIFMKAALKIDDFYAPKFDKS